MSLAIISLVVPVALTLIIWGWTADAIRKRRGTRQLGLGRLALLATSWIWAGYLGGLLISYLLVPRSATEVLKIGGAIASQVVYC